MRLNLFLLTTLALAPILNGCTGTAHRAADADHEPAAAKPAFMPLMPAGTHTLGTPMQGRTMRASSSDENDWVNGNGDARRIAPGQELEIADLEGPGRIQHIWFTIAHPHPFFARTMTLRIYYDGSEVPAVEAPIGDFFAIGHGMRRFVDSRMVAVSSEGRAFNCYWPMPFRDSVRLTVSNDVAEDDAILFWYVDWVKLGHLPEDTPYFHAQYRQERPVGPGDYLIADIEGRGYYVGTVLSVLQHYGGWFGEGDDRFYIDGENVPSLLGTGTEDYFCDAWGFREFTHPFYGVPIWEGMVRGGRVTAYRWHVHDPVLFERSLRLEIEHKGTVTDNATGAIVNPYGERPDYFSSVAFWYQTGTAKRFGGVPPVDQRVQRQELIELEGGVQPGDEIMIQESPTWSGGKQVLWMNLSSTATFDIPFTIPEGSDDYIVELLVTRSWDYGTFDVLVDGAPMLTAVDLWKADGETMHTLRLGDGSTIPPGEHTLTFRTVGAHEGSRVKHLGGRTGYYLGADALLLRYFD